MKVDEAIIIAQDHWVANSLVNKGNCKDALHALSEEVERLRKNLSAAQSVLKEYLADDCCDKTLTIINESYPLPHKREPKCGKCIWCRANEAVGGC